MTMEDEEFARKSAIQQNLRSGMIEETPTDRVLREVMVIDPLITEFLSGDLFNVLDGLRTWVVAAKNVMDKGISPKLLVLLDRLETEWEQTKRFRPYLLLLSHLTSLTNLSEKDAVRYLRKIDILIGRDLLDMAEDDIELNDFNFYDALKMACHFRIHDSVKGWKAKILTEQRKRFLTEIQTSAKKKGGMLGRGGRFL